MVGINDNAILDRIKENLEHISNDLFGDTANNPKFTKIVFGDPANDKKLAEAGNVCYIRMAEKPFVATKKKLRMKADRKRKIITKAVWIQLVSKGGGTLETSLRELNDLTYKTTEAIEKNTFLKKPDGTLPIAHNLEIFDVPRDIETIAKERQSQMIVCHYDFTSQ